MNPRVEDYFKNLGIDVEFNTIGLSKSLRDAFVFETKDLINSTEYKRSEFFKHECYSKFYNLEFRNKMTGFENVDELAKEFKIKQSGSLYDLQFSGCDLVEDFCGFTDYKNLLKEELNNIQKPILLYLSGGIDSEFVAMALLDANIKFTPVIFKWTSVHGIELNDAETKYAINFCNNNSLTPIIKIVDIYNLWNSDNFYKLSDELQLFSAHLTTHAYMVKMMDIEFPNNKHLFGGEVRYRTDYVMDDNSLSNLVSLGKVVPGFNSALYTEEGTSSSTASIFLELHNDGTWQVLGSGASGPGSPGSGTWTTTPGTTYEYRISTISASSVSPSGAGSIVPSSAPTSWSTITSTVVAFAVNALSTASPPGPGTCSASFTIDFRKVGDVTPVVSANTAFQVNGH